MKFLPSRWLLIALLGSALLVALVPFAGFATGLALLLLFFLDAFACRSLGPPEMDVRIPTRTAQNEEGKASLEITNRSGRVLPLWLLLDVPSDLAGEEIPEIKKFDLKSLERAKIEIPLLARTRGNHVIRSLDFRILGPLRLAWWQSSLPLNRKVEVIPGLSEVRSWRLLALHHHLHQAGFRSVRLRGEGGSFESLREYVRGDDPRHISWKASARHGTHIVRQYEVERSQSIVLCIDAGRLMAEKIGPGERLDKALAAAVVLNEVARVWNDQVGAFAFSDGVHALLPPARHPPDRIPSLFAQLPSRNVEPDYPRALMRLSRFVTRRSLLVFFGDVIDEEVSAPLAAQLSRLARRHLPLFIALRNSDLFALSGAAVTDRKSAHRRAAAMELVLARAKTLARMRENGIWVADVPPEAAVAATINQYVQIKRRGVL